MENNNIIELSEYLDENLITIQIAAKILGVSRTEVYRLLDAGYVKEHTTEKGKKMVEKKSVEYYLYLKDQIRYLEEQIKNIAEGKE